MAIVRARKVGSSLYICIPALMCKRSGIKNGDFFRVERDLILPNIYTLTKLDDNTNEI